MLVFVYEYISGGGMWEHPSKGPTGTLLAEGAAMLRTVIADFSTLDDVTIATTRDVRLGPLEIERCKVTPIASIEDERTTVWRLAARADWTLLIAPESGGALVDRCRLVEDVGGRLLSPSSACVAIAGNKHATADLLEQQGVPVPRGILLEAGQRELTSVSFPAVVKPVDACGSHGVRLVRSVEHIGSGDGQLARRIEEYVRGLPASVAVLCGPRGNHALPTCEQRLSADGSFAYLGGRLPLDPELDSRARKLALAAIGSLPGARGYLGVDLVMGDATDGSGDRVIEINPRLTTSYVGLRALSRTNLAAAMLAVAAGTAPDLCFSERPVEFSANGTVTFL